MSKEHNFVIEVSQGNTSSNIFNDNKGTPKSIDKTLLTMTDNLLQVGIPKDTYELFLDNLITLNSNLSSENNTGILVQLFKSNGLYTSSITYYNTHSEIPKSLLIPNDNTSASNFQSSVVNKSKKFNYVCDIEAPGQINNIKISNLAGESIFCGNLKNINEAITNPTIPTNVYTLSDISESFSATNTSGFIDNYDVFPLQEGDFISNLQSASYTSASNSCGCILSNTPINPTDFNFSYPFIESASLVNFNASKNITFNLTRYIPDSSGGGSKKTATITLSRDINNYNLRLIRGTCKFIAEFTLKKKKEENNNNIGNNIGNNNKINF